MQARQIKRCKRGFRLSSLPLKLSSNYLQISRSYAKINVKNSKTFKSIAGTSNKNDTRGGLDYLHNAEKKQNSKELNVPNGSWDFSP